MITSIRQANEQFFRLFHNISIQVKGSDKQVNCRYARKSSFDYAEEQETQIYPCIAIQDYAPVPKDNWFVDLKEYFGGKSLDGLTGYLYRRPVWLEFKYDVSIAAKGYNEYLALQDYFLKRFMSEKSFIYNKKLDGELAVGDVVPYDVRDTDIPRTDGVYETNYEFTCSVWVHAVEPREVELVKDIIINLLPKNLD